MKINLALYTLLLSAPALVAQAPSDTPAQETRRLSLNGFLAEVLKTNLDLAANRFNITSAEAEIAIARLFPDPEIAAGISSKELYGPNKPESPTEYGVELSWLLELGGKRSARTEVAKSGVKKAKAEFDLFLEELRSAAATAFIEALKARAAAAEKRKIHAGFAEIVRMNEIRYSAGDIGGVELAQARMEARKFGGELVQADAEARIAAMALIQFLETDALPFEPSGGLDFADASIDADEILSSAINRGPDLQTARQSLELAKSEVKLAKANRWIDLGLSIGLNHAPALFPNGFDIEPINKSNTLSAMISVPIPFSRRSKGELVQAEAAKSQARLELSSAELKTRTEARAALAQYDAALRCLKTFQEGILKDADKVLEASRHSYQKGHISLMEYVMTQQSCTEAYLSYIDAQADYAMALIGLDRITGGGSYLLGAGKKMDN
jgi:cobalt-zinc-cadmium efflux system outer membrane protein